MAKANYSFNSALVTTRGEIIKAVHAFRTSGERYDESFTLTDDQLVNAWRHAPKFRAAIKALGGTKHGRGKVKFPNKFARRVIVDWLQLFEGGDLWNVVGGWLEPVDHWHAAEYLQEHGTREQLKNFIKRVARRKGWRYVVDVCRYFSGDIAERAFDYDRFGRSYITFIEQPLVKVW